MRFMIIVKSTSDSEAGVMPGEQLIAAMASYHEELAKAGVLLDAAGLQPSTRMKAWRIKYSGAKRNVIDGPALRLPTRTDKEKQMLKTILSYLSSTDDRIFHHTRLYG